MSRILVVCGLIFLFSCRVVKTKKKGPRKCDGKDDDFNERMAFYCSSTTGVHLFDMFKCIFAAPPGELKRVAKTMLKLFECKCQPLLPLYKSICDYSKCKNFEKLVNAIKTTPYINCCFENVPKNTSNSCIPDENSLECE